MLKTSQTKSRNKSGKIIFSGTILVQENYIKQIVILEIVIVLPKKANNDVGILSLRFRFRNVEYKGNVYSIFVRMKE